ncbi:MAG: mono/diheme cytochrome c family protein [Acidimicrobiales bacterium]|jgi:mono/diheme cytochrome c family protein
MWVGKSLGKNGCSPTEAPTVTAGMTEIPEHLLKRSKAAKSGKTGGDAGDAPSGSEVVAATESAAPVATGPKALADAAAVVPADKPTPVAAPDPPYIAAAKSRKKMPLWAMGLVAALPVWALAYAGTMQEPEVEDLLFIDAAEVYTSGGCAGCHGAGGDGATGYAFTNGEVIATFPEAIDHMAHVARGSTPILDEAYGDPARDGGQRVSGARGNGAMPAQIGGLSLTELELVVFHERAVLSGEDTSSESYQLWIEHLREAIESGVEKPIDLDLLLACASPEYTPGATGAIEDKSECPGPHAAEEEVAASE